MQESCILNWPVRSSRIDMPGHQDSPRSNHAVMSIPAAEVWQGARIIECVPFHDAGLHFFRFSSCKRYHIGGSELDSLGFAEHGQIRGSKESIVFLCLISLLGPNQPHRRREVPSGREACCPDLRASSRCSGRMTGNSYEARIDRTGPKSGFWEVGPTMLTCAALFVQRIALTDRNTALGVR
jgi:hypothetical protein